MASANPTQESNPSPSAQVVGNAFVEQYYHILHHSPELAHRFYQDNSVLSRPSPDGLMRTVTTMKSINETICSLDYKNYKAEIKTADAQDSFRDGVVLLVTGSLTGNDHQKRKFTQTFFLAPQDTGYFVLNDVFRYVEDGGPEIISGFGIRDDGSSPSGASNQVQEPAQVIDPPKTDFPAALMEVIEAAEEQRNGHVIDGKPPIQDKAIVPEPDSQASENHSAADSEAVISASEEDAPKKSYASIVSSQTKRGPMKIYVPTNSARAAAAAAAAKAENQSFVNQATEVSSSIAAKPPAETHDVADEDEGHSIYIRNLPINATVNQLEAEFKKFGPIKPDGIQVRGNRQQGFCFGFVEFLELSSMQSAIEASPITIGDRPAVVEAKRTTSRVGNGRSRFASSTRGSFRSDNFRARGSGRAYVRSDSYRERGNPREGYQHGRGATRPNPVSNLS
ncbi:hypothetical protein M569_03247 [Genlisea aurea]|uniref:Uncharacterized protein n=1 Tax=Genlisea aurea TaxID=192259 RepID=S8EFU2_9LAMI|nr:hypothetical protein M569_03247 [Genlisea aurea]